MDHRLENAALRKLINATRYVSNHTIYNYLKMKCVQDEAKTFYKRSSSYPLVNNLAA